LINCIIDGILCRIIVEAGPLSSEMLHFFRKLYGICLLEFIQQNRAVLPELDCVNIDDSSHSLELIPTEKHFDENKVLIPLGGTNN
jgi:hypothetical protein